MIGFGLKKQMNSNIDQRNFELDFGLKQMNNKKKLISKWAPNEQ